MVNITIDGEALSVPKGENLLKVIRERKNNVPNYCYHPGLSIAGACRMCMVEVEKAPRPIIACNTFVTDGMVVKTQTDQVKNIQKWNLSFHLINHPLDCPICDQAGECGLQDYYMEYGKYNSEMQEKKVLKRKVVSIGEQVMLDTERCILCSRCVRFFDEIPKTSEMGIFNRGDRAEIGTYLDKDLDNNYTLNSVDICPVGALTSKDFRFQKRVWLLKEFDSICPGCSTGCNTTIGEDPREKRTFRMLPRENQDVNGYWMCDYGRMRYKQTNLENRIQTPTLRMRHGLRPTDWQAAQVEFTQLLKTPPAELAVFVPPQYTNEELAGIYAFFHDTIKTKNIYHCVDADKAKNPKIIDEVFMRDDRNPNSQGLLAISKKYNLENSGPDAFAKAAGQSHWKTLIVFGPEDCQAYPDFLTQFKGLNSVKKVLIGTQKAHATTLFDLILPTLSFVEKEGTFVNYKGMAQKIKAGVQLIPQAKPLSEILCL